MDSKNNEVILYTSQHPIVIETINNKGVYHVKGKYIKKKYQDVSKIFLEGYNWYVSRAEKLVQKPEGAEYPIWTFTSPKYVTVEPGEYFITLRVPIDKVIFFDPRDWNKILNLEYLPKNTEDEENFSKILESYGIRSDEAFNTSFYPHLKSRIKKSWDTLFERVNPKNIKCNSSDINLQASLWEIKSSWIISLQQGR